MKWRYIDNTSLADDVGFWGMYFDSMKLWFILCAMKISTLDLHTHVSRQKLISAVCSRVRVHVVDQLAVPLIVYSWIPVN